MFRTAILVIVLVCLSLTALAQPPGHNSPPGHHPPEKHQHFIVDISADRSGDVSPMGRLSVRRGETVVVSIRPHRGFIIKDVFIDGRNIGPVAEYKFSRIDRDHRAHIEFAPASHRPSPNPPHNSPRR